MAGVAAVDGIADASTMNFSSLSYRAKRADDLDDVRNKTRKGDRSSIALWTESERESLGGSDSVG
ncbi:MAG: hypothetical protein ACM4AI_21585 [Acidobacteriota bacterium]